MKAFLLFFFILLLGINDALCAQCAMCKTTIVNNVSNGELALAEGLNFGIMYLFFAPYVVVFVLAGVWFYKYRRHAEKQGSSNSTL